MVNKINFISFRELNKLSLDHDIFFFGCSNDWVPKTISNLNFKPKFFIDNNNDLHGKEYAGVKVISLSKLCFSFRGFKNNQYGLNKNISKSCV